MDQLETRVLPAGITVTPTSGLVTTEAGGTASFTVVLDSLPSGVVTIPISSSNINEGTVSTALLTFTALNWSTAQTVTITGQPDTSAHNVFSYTIITGAATSLDSSYNGLDAADVSVTNIDVTTPVAVDDAYSTLEDTALSVNVGGVLTMTRTPASIR